MKKRLLAAIMSLCMIVSLLPVSAFAVEPEPDPGAVFTKSAALNEATGDVTITMEAYATGEEVVIPGKSVPLDIVLVLDQSGSMTDPFGNTTRQAAMKQAVSSFVGEVAKNAAENDPQDEVHHQIGIVTFASNSRVRLPLTDAEDNEQKITQTINNLSDNPSGATQVDKGMSAAKDMLSGSDVQEDSKKVVIVFTDGVPTTNREFDTTVANSAIATAKELKDIGVSIYTVGIFGGADINQLYGNTGFDRTSDGSIGSDWSDFSFWMIGDIQGYDVPAGNRFLNYLSSNYAATNIGIKEYSKTILGIGYRGWEITQNFTRISPADYYLTAANAEDLNNVFSSIADSIGNTANANLDKDTVIQDVVSQYYTAPNQADIKVYKQAYKGNNTWDNRVDITSQVTVRVVDKTVTVTGYDYAADYVSQEPKQDGTYGEKLVIEFTVTPTATASATKDIPTNDSAQMLVDNNTIATANTPTVPGNQLTYNANLGELTGFVASAPPSQFYAPGCDSVSLSGEVTLTPETEGNEPGVVFVGWSQDRTHPASNPASEAVSTIPSLDLTSETNTVYAVWAEDKNNNGEPDYEEDTYTVIYTDGVNNKVFAAQPHEGLLEGTATPKFDTDGISVDKNGNPDRQDYVFTNWTPKVADTVGGDEHQIIYTATWADDKNNNDTPDVEEEKYTITYKDGKPAEAIGDVTGMPLDQTGILSGTEQDWPTAPSLDGYSFTGWSVTPSTVIETSGKFTMPTDNVIFTATWEKIQPEFVSVRYEFKDSNGSDITDSAVLAVKPANTTAEKGTNVSPATLSESDQTIQVENGTWTFVKWDPESAENVQTDVTFTGIWEFKETEKEYAQVDYIFQSSDDTKLPEEVTNLCPSPSQAEVGTSVSAPTLSQTAVTVEDGTWTFQGWDEPSKGVSADGVIFIGTWTFRPNPSDKKITVIFDISGEDCAWKSDSPYEEQKFVVTENGSESYTIPEVVPTAENKEFVTWKLRDGTTNGTLSGTEFTYATVEQFAVFDENGEATITFVPVLQEKAAPEVESVTLIFDVSSEPDAKWENSHIGHSVWVMLDAAVPTDYAPGVYAEGKEFKYWTSEVGSLGGKQLLTFEEFKAYAIAEKLPIVDGNVTIVYTPVFEKIPEPETPEPPDSNFTLKNAVQIVCTTNGTHGTKDYDLISGRYYALEPTQNVDGTWICDINVISDEYINDFDDSTGTKHELTLPQNGTKTIRLEYNGSKWVPAEDMIPCVFYVECESESEVPDTITVYFDISDAVSENSDVAWTYAYPGYNQPVTLLSDKDDAANAPLVDIPDGWEFVKWDSGANTLDEQGARFTFEDMLEIATPDAKGNWTVTYDLVIQKSGEDPDPETPEVPGLPEIEDLLDSKIIVQCTTNPDEHPYKPYGLLTDGYALAEEVSGSAEDGWTYEITIYPSAYVAEYNSEGWGKHSSSESEPLTRTITLAYTENGWEYLDAPITIDVTCEGDEPVEPTEPTLPDGDEVLSALEKSIILECLTLPVDHDKQFYDLLPGTYEVDKTSLSYNNGSWTLEVTIFPDAYLKEFNSTYQTTEGHVLVDENDQLAGGKAILTYADGSWTCLSGNGVTFEVMCQTSPEPDTYTVTFNTNGGTTDSWDQSVTDGDTLTLDATASWDDQHIFLGWSSNGSVKGQVYGAGDQVPKAEESITPTGDVTVYAIWAEDLNGDKIPDANQIVIRPADITIYTGGTGYEGIVTDEDGSTVSGSEETGNGLPEPGYYLVLPYTLNEKLGDNPEEMVDLSNILRFTYGDNRTWDLVRYNDNDNLGSSSAYGYYIYKMVPAVTGQDPVRLQIKDGDNFILSDEFIFNLDSLFQEYQMSLYTGAVSAGGVKAQLQINGVWTDVDEADANGLCLREGLLTVRGVNEEDVREIESDVSSPVSQITAEADSNVTYYINDSDIPVTNQDGVALLADSLVGEGIYALRAEVQETLGIDENHSFQYKYLDLVDASNGNAYVTLKNDDTVKIHWPMPAGTNANTKFYVVHFDGLDREFDGNSLGDILDSPDVKQIVYSAENGNLSIENGNLVFSTGTFSPFVLVYEDDTTGPVDPDEPGGGESGGGSDSDPTGNLTISKRVSGAAGDREDTFTFTVYLTDEDGDELEANFYYNGSGYSGNIGDGDSITLSGGESITIRNLPVGTRYEVVEEEANEDGYVTTSSGEEGTIRSSQTYTAAFTNTRNAVLATPEETGVDRWLNTDDHIAYLTGYPGDVFGPDNSMTRAEVAQMFYALLRDKNVTITKTFPDVPADAWYATAVNTLASLGMVTGDSNGNFRPNDPITRAEFCVVALAFAYEPASYSCNFSDVARTDWFYPYVAQATVYGWIGGYTDGSFGPRDSITRAQVTTIVNNMLGRAADQDYVIDHQDELVQFVDLNRTHWAYYQIMEAVNAHDYTKTGGSENWR